MKIADYVVQNVPAQVKPVVDILAIGTALSAIVGALTTFFGLLAAMGSAVWAWLRVYDYLKARKK